MTRMVLRRRSGAKPLNSLKIFADFARRRLPSAEQPCNLAVMKRTVFLTAVALAALAGAAQAEPTLKRPSFFMQPGQSASLLKGIDRYTADKIDFNRRFSLTFVPCGIACGSFWFVDRRTGGVIEAPTTTGPIATEDTWEVEAKPDSNVIRVIYGPRDPVIGARCTARHFRWTGKAFTPIDPLAVILCPE